MTASNPTVWLTLQAHDAPTLIDYYVETFGFVLAARYGQGETVDHAQLNWPHGSGGIMLGTHKPDAQWCREPGTTGGYVVTADPDGLYERCCSIRPRRCGRQPKPTTAPANSLCAIPKATCGPSATTAAHRPQPARYAVWFTKRTEEAPSE